MEKTKFSKVPPILLAILGVLLLLLGLKLNDDLDRLFKPPLLMHALNLLPGIALIGAIFIINKISRFRSQLIIIFTVFVFLFLGMFFADGVVGFQSSIKPETDPADYRDILEVFGQRNFLKHFPPGIPENASNVSLCWNKGFLQSSWSLQLRFVLPSNEIQSLLDQSRTVAAKTPDPKSSSFDNPPPMIPLFAGEVEPLLSWPEDFEIIVFNYAKSRNADDEGYGTKGYRDIRHNYGVAISTERNEIIYWVEEYPW